MKNNKEQTCNNLDVSPEIYTEWKKPIPKGCTLCDFIHMPFHLSEKANSKDV